MGEKKWVKTLNLPKTSFPMKAQLSQKEPLILKKWEKMDIYHKILKEREDSPLFILHDGPPYANGRIHLGHALNKILKDFVVKSKSMQGYKTPYVPGWDCHGLPIEKKVEIELGDKKNTMTKAQIRKECKKYAEKYIKLQRDEFIRLGVFGEWKNPYKTIDKEYEHYIIKYFASFVKNGNVYRKKKPIYWCPTCKTALAEAEIEYHDDKSPSIYVRFKIKNIEDKFPELKGKPVYVIIWTTTPWTLPANLAVALHPEDEYDIFEYKNEYYIAGSRLVPIITEKFGWNEYRTYKRLEGKFFEGLKAEHPIFENKESIFVTADYVTMEDGTGCVHTAPGHGEEDYLTGLKYNLEIYSPVDDEGKFDKSVHKYEGQFVFSANKNIVEDLKNQGKLILYEEFTHSYPHCWRCKNPIIFRATEQWFISLDEGELRKKALEEIKKVKWIPEWGEERIKNMVENRPDWCISRQRAWGVPIPAFYCKDCGETILNEELTLHVAELFKEKGSDYWFVADTKELLPQNYRCPKCGSENLEKEEDILDVWFESGASHSVLQYYDDHTYPSDVYLEGNDQYRGWFQSSLLVGVSARGRSPYKTVITHGWVLDEQGRAMSKSLGNVIEPQEIIKDKGAEIIRLWVAMVNYQEDLKLGDKILSGLTEAYKKIRNTWRFMLGNLNDYTPEEIKKEELLPVDRYILEKYEELRDKIVKAYNDYSYHKIYHMIYNFFTVDLSAFYLNITKDRLYCSAPNWKERKAVQSTIFYILKNTLLLMAPILPFTTEEAWEHLPEFSQKRESIHLHLFPESNHNWLSEEEKEEWQKIEEIRELVLKNLEEIRNEKIIGDSLEAKVKLELKDDYYDTLKKYEKYLKELFVVSEVSIEKSDENKISSQKVEGKKCPRCWNYSKEIGKDKEYPELCPRCVLAVKEIESK